MTLSAGQATSTRPIVQQGAAGSRIDGDISGNNIMILVKILSYISWAVLSLWSRSLKIRLVNRNIPDRLLAEGKNAIYAFWHDSVFLLPFTHRNSDVVIMVSESRDGEIAARLLSRFGFAVVRGSSKRKGNRALISLITRLSQGKSIAIAVDGPRGPRHKSKDGAIFLAGKLQVPIIPAATWSKRCWTLEKAWDKLVIPVPFTEGVVQYGQPIIVNGTSKEEIELKRKKLETVLRSLKQDAATHAVAHQNSQSAVGMNKTGFS